MDTLKCEVVTLPHNQGVIHIGKHPNTYDRIYLNKVGNNMTTSHHLFLTSNREIQDGDWGITYDLNKALLLRYPGGLDKRRSWLKVEATTDPELYVKYPMETAGHFLNKPLPLIPQSFVEKYVQQQGKIKEVLVEVYDHAALFLGYETGDVKTRPDGTCIIHKVKDSWTREEVLEMLNKLGENSIYIPKGYILDWFNENY